MRCCSAARILTLISLTILSSHSLVNAKPPSVGNTPTVTPTPSLSSSDPVNSPPSSTPFTPPPTDSPVPSSSTDLSQPSSTSDISTPSQASSLSFFGSSSSSSFAAPTSSSPSDTPTSSSPSIASGFSSAPSSFVSSSSSSSVSSPTSPSTTPKSTSQSAADTTLVVPATDNFQPSASYVYFSSTRSIPSQSNAPAATGDASTNVSSGGSSKSFLQNTGAMAGTFTVVGLVALAAVVALVVRVRRYRRRRSDDELAGWFEKDNEPSYGGAADRASSFVSGENSDGASAMAPASADAYPDRSTHYGDLNMAEYGNPHTEYPPGTAYAAAASQQGQYVYTGQPGGYSTGYTGQASGYANGYTAQAGGYANNYAGQASGYANTYTSSQAGHASEYANSYTGQAAGYTNGYHDKYSLSNPSSAPTPHPFADPSNVSKGGGAPPVTAGQEPSRESEYWADAYVEAE